MDKLKVVETKTIEKETNVYLPAFFQFQDDNGFDEFVMIEKHQYTKVEYFHGGIRIEKGLRYTIHPHYIERNLSTPAAFSEAYKEALKLIGE